MAAKRRVDVDGLLDGSDAHVEHLLKSGGAHRGKDELRELAHVEAVQVVDACGNLKQVCGLNSFHRIHADRAQPDQTR
jgi:hypothetical protein